MSGTQLNSLLKVRQLRKSWGIDITQSVVKAKRHYTIIIRILHTEDATTINFYALNNTAPKHRKQNYQKYKEKSKEILQL